MVGAVVRLDYEGACPGATYILENPRLLDLLFDGCALSPLVNPGDALLYPSTLLEHFAAPKTES